MDPAEDKVQKKPVSQFYDDFDSVAILDVPNRSFVKSELASNNLFGHHGSTFT